MSKNFPRGLGDSHALRGAQELNPSTMSTILGRLQQ